MRGTFGHWAVLIFVVVALATALTRTPRAKRARSTHSHSPQPIADVTDTFHDGTPDFLRLHDPSDRSVFVTWFTFIAEAEYFAEPAARPHEINDCAALIRFAYRDALRKHDGAWAASLKLRELPPVASVAQYDYPHTPLGSALFRVSSGSFRADDIHASVFREFANARMLQKFNTYFVDRDIRSAQPGDLLFFRQDDQRLPWHAMIFVGATHFTNGHENWIVYHTGPSGNHNRSGELRRVTVQQLLNHRFTRWRPLSQNPAFLGVFRWNILREAD